MVSSPLVEPSVADILALTTGVVVRTQKRIGISATTKSENSALSRKTLDALRASYDGLASRSDPFTVDMIGAPRSE